MKHSDECHVHIGKPAQIVFFQRFGNSHCQRECLKLVFCYECLFND